MFPQRRSTALLAALFVPFLLANKGCDESEDVGQTSIDATVEPSGDGKTCSPSECGDKPTAPTLLCSDGTLSGYGMCKRLPDDSCGYVFHKCPVADASVPLEDASALDAMLREPDADVTRPDAESTRPDAGMRCGTRGSSKCENGQFCNYVRAAQCGANDLGGTCEPLAEGCLDNGEPVCGCDDRSHPSACHANALGVSVMHEGLCSELECRKAGGVAVIGEGGNPPKCREDTVQWELNASVPTLCCAPRPSPGRVCGGFANLPCGSAQWCNTGTEAGGLGCYVKDNTGTCQSLQQPCPFEYIPVCGCDLRTYSNLCAANVLQVVRLHDGACTDVECTESGGEVVRSIGNTPTCPEGSESFGGVQFTIGPQPIDGAICCRKVTP